MISHDIEQIIANKMLPGRSEHIELIETHSAWVLLTPDFAFKIKKPVRFSFLDFSTLELRKYYCLREIALNSRLAPEVYLQMLPVKQNEDAHFIGEGEGVTIDYCVQMKRIDNQREMNRLLKQDLVTEADMKKLAEKIAAFHHSAKLSESAFSADTLIEQFADIRSVESILIHFCGEEVRLLLSQMISYARLFINTHTPRFAWRQNNDFVRDLHGDLHSGNIFLLEDPIIFDCIEFNDDFRQMDVLDEIAFLCMDLDYYQRYELGEVFLKAYLKQFPCIHDTEDHRLFWFYKWYRAGVRLKVNCLSLKGNLPAEEREQCIFRVQQYYYVFKTYYHMISSGSEGDFSTIDKTQYSV